MMKKVMIFLMTVLMLFITCPVLTAQAQDIPTPFDKVAKLVDAKVTDKEKNILYFEATEQGVEYYYFIIGKLVGETGVTLGIGKYLDGYLIVAEYNMTNKQFTMWHQMFGRLEAEESDVRIFAHEVYDEMKALKLIE